MTALNTPESFELHDGMRLVEDTRSYANDVVWIYNSGSNGECVLILEKFIPPLSERHPFQLTQISPHVKPGDKVFYRDELVLKYLRPYNSGIGIDT